MSKWHWILLGGAVLLVGVVGFGLYITRPYPPGTGNTWENLASIQPGMSLAEVEQVLGRPYDDEWRTEGFEPITANPPPKFHTVVIWWGSAFQYEALSIVVYVDRDLRVVAAQSYGGQKPSTPLERAGKRLGL